MLVAGPEWKSLSPPHSSNMLAAHRALRRRNASPSREHTCPNLASQMRAAFSKHRLEYRLELAGEELMTLSTSDVAVCCSSDCRSSLSSRVFSMAMTA